jgi:hypothetical protein
MAARVDLVEEENGKWAVCWSTGFTIGGFSSQMIAGVWLIQYLKENAVAVKEMEFKRQAAVSLLLEPEKTQ